MKPFLLELAEAFHAQYGRNPERCTVVFPNRRAALYFRHYLASLISKPAFAPSLLTIEEFISSYSGFRIADKLDLIDRLHKVYDKVMSEETSGGSPYGKEPFDRFYFWGDMLLKDFDEADRYMVDAELLFRDLSKQKELDSAYDYLTEEQREFLRNFWKAFDENDSENKKRFLAVWKMMPSVYRNFRLALNSEGRAYEGMLHRDVAENIRERAGKDVNRTIWFVGFNALTKAEEIIISHFVATGGASVFWDIDDYYFNNQTQEAGRFFREYREHTVLGPTFPHDIPANLKSLKKIELYGAPHPIGQAKLLSQLLQEKLSGGLVPNETLVVLPDEKLLIPVLHGISGEVDTLNVTMGFPLGSTPLYNLIELLVELQLTRKDEMFNHRAVTSLLGHPYVVASGAAEAQARRRQIASENRVYVPDEFLGSTIPLHRQIFRPVSKDGDILQSLLEWLTDVVTETGKLSNLSDFDREYCYHFLQLLNRLSSVLPSAATGEPGVTVSEYRERLKSFLRLFRQLTNSEKVPFTGEPLGGLQVMGVLETRNLDFKNVFILSLNEGLFPASSGRGSYIPYNIRKAYGLPTPEQQDAIFAYLFYRTIQRAERVYLFCNTESDALGQGEMSRYLQQLIYESGIRVERHVLHNELQPYSEKPLSVPKDDKVYEQLSRYLDGSPEKKYLSPSALNDYLECRLRFYFRYVARIREAKEVEEDLDARILGNFLHKVMELFYAGILARKGTNQIEKSDFRETKDEIGALIDKTFSDHYNLNPSREVVYEGQRLVVREIVSRFVDRILAFDKDYAPFQVEALERRDLTIPVVLPFEGRPRVMVGGSIDRADKKGDTVRVVDYKTGKDDLEFAGVAPLFERDGKDRNKAAFQTLLYTLLYKHNVPASPGMKLIPGLMNRLNLFHDDFTFGLNYDGKTLEDAAPLLDEFSASLNVLLSEVFDPTVPFDQTTDVKKCEWCAYTRICFRM